MSRSQNNYIKRQKALKKKKKRDDKLQRKVDKKNQDTSGELNDMIAYVDENGNISDKPPKENNDEEKNSFRKPNERN